MSDAPTCMECSSTTILVGGQAIYPHRRDLYSRNFYLCTCGAYCGTHRGTTKALGYPCGRKTRWARSKAHAALDPLWREGEMSRRSAYKWLAEALGIDIKECHIGMMDADTANRVVELVNERTVDA